MAENFIRSSRKTRNHLIPSDRETDPTTNSNRPFKPTTISSILLSTNENNRTKKNNFTTATFRGLGCTASSHVSVPAAIRSSANWEPTPTPTTTATKNLKKNKKKNKRLIINNNNDDKVIDSSSSLGLALSSSCVGVLPDVWCAPGIALATDAASVDCVVSRRPGRGKVDGVDRIIGTLGHRERPYTVRRMVTSEDIPLLESDNVHRLRSDVYGSRHHHRHVRHGFQEGLAEIVMLQRGRLDGVDRYRDLRLDVDNMSYEELVELGERIGCVNTGLGEDDIACCLRRSKLAICDDFSSHFLSEAERKCSICQEEYEADDEIGKLKCGHFYHIDCIKQWLGQKNICPICKTAALSLS